MAELPARFPDLTLPDLRGGRRRLAAAPGPTLVCLGHGDCGTTRLLLPYVERIHRRAAGAEVVAVLQDTPADARALVDELGLTLPVFLDEEPWPLGAALGLSSIPLTLLLQRGGRIARGWEAFRRADVEAAATAAGVPAPFFEAGDQAPALRPG